MRAFYFSLSQFFSSLLFFITFLELHYIIIILLNSIAPNTIQYRLSNETLKHFQINDLLFSLVAGNQKNDDNNKKDCEEEKEEEN